MKDKSLLLYLQRISKYATKYVKLGTIRTISKLGIAYQLRCFTCWSWWYSSLQDYANVKSTETTTCHVPYAGHEGTYFPYILVTTQYQTNIKSNQIETNYHNKKYLPTNKQTISSISISISISSISYIVSQSSK